LVIINYRYNKRNSPKFSNFNKQNMQDSKLRTDALFRLKVRQCFKNSIPWSWKWSLLNIIVRRREDILSPFLVLPEYGQSFILIIQITIQWCAGGGLLDGFRNLRQADFNRSASVSTFEMVVVELEGWTGGGGVELNFADSSSCETIAQYRSRCRNHLLFNFGFSTKIFF